MNSADTQKRRDYVIRILIRHPHLDLSEVTEKTGLEPRAEWKRADQVLIQKGQARVRDSSIWSYIEDGRFDTPFSVRVSELIEILSKEKGMLLRIIETGGEIQLIVGLAGSSSSGDSLPSSALASLAKMGARLGFEVFPSL